VQIQVTVLVGTKPSEEASLPVLEESEELLELPQAARDSAMVKASASAKSLFMMFLLFIQCMLKLGDNKR
jgi:hypothetical protein